MQGRIRSASVAALCGVALIAGLAAAFSPAGESASNVTTVMRGLDAPRGLAFAPNGDLYVAEAGRGAACAGTNELTLPPRDIVVCIGNSGAISRLRRGGQTRVVTGLPSWISKVPGPALEITGPHDVAFRRYRHLYVLVGWGGTPAERTKPPAAGRPFGHLLRLGPHRAWKSVADVAAYEQANDPAGPPVDSNPFGILAGLRRPVVVDAGANAVYRVAPRTKTSLLAALPTTQNPPGCTIPAPPPPRPAPPVSESVPTAVARGPDGALYVGELSGFPFCAGAARIWRLERGRQPSVHLTGFKMIMDIAFARDGALYVLEYATSPALPGGPGALIRVTHDGTRTPIDTAGALMQPAGLAIGRDGSIYVSNKAVAPGEGEVLRIAP